ncbi:hypothetical protein BgiBS90_015120, partial [Biomphalaria glabrata]
VKKGECIWLRMPQVFNPSWSPAWRSVTIAAGMLQASSEITANSKHAEPRHM